MSSDLTPRTPSTAPVPADNDNRYKAVQAKLDKFAKAMDDITLELQALHRSMWSNAARTEDVTTDIENAELDAKFVRLTANVALALVGAAREVRKLQATARETANLAHTARRTHARLYGALDDIRSNRPEKTPRPGFLDR
ncbi:conjugal transfer protein TraB [Streptomyces naphthomycinicus]|uniref:conjugal transfer protein TraB n=1 Tax=Streptomyces naphthomycinicus TaxID=2872625 RepID=UPI001CEDE9D8|nr:conjugal transfer protein TraB [Streptomyces sp. TML10]